MKTLDHAVKQGKREQAKFDREYNQALVYFN